MKNLAAKMLKIMSKVSYIEKNGVNSFHKYKYARDVDVMGAFSKAFQEEGVFPFCSILERGCESSKNSKGEDTYLITVKYQLTLVDVDSGEQFVGTFFGDGADKGDKGVYKAITGAHKYALLKMFSVPTGDDPEKDNHQEVQSGRNNQRQNNNTARTRDEIKLFLEAVANDGVDSLRDAWTSMHKRDKKLVEDLLPSLKEMAAGAKDG